MRDSWTEVKLGAVCTTFAGGTPSRSNPSFYNGDIPWISSGEVNQATITKTSEHITEKALKLSSAKWIPENAVLMAMYGATAGQVSKLKIRATSNQAVLALIPRKDDNDFIYHQLKLRKEKILFFAQGSGQPNLSKNLIDSTLIPLPPLPHQRKIAKILNTIDAVMEKTEAAIAKYKALKQGMMQDLFTRGIDPQTGKLRPSQKDAPELYKETELGWILKEWMITNLENSANLITDGAHFSPVPQEDGLPIGNVKDMTSYGFNYEKCTKIKKEVFRELKRQNCSPIKDDVLLSKDGTIGKVILFSGSRDIVLLSSIAIIRPSKKVNPEYLSFVLQSGYFDLELYKLVSGSALKRITLRDIKKMRMPFPQNLEEQFEISKKLNRIMSLIHKEQTNLSKHQSLKKGLMQDLLTGKVEVEV